MVFGHMYTLITVKLPSSEASEIVLEKTNLVDFCRRIEEEYFRERELSQKSTSIQ